jgi:acetate kinase
MGKLILILNPGSSSRKYALYDEQEFLAGLHFETDRRDEIVCTFEDADHAKSPVETSISSLNDASVAVQKILENKGLLSGTRKLFAVVARLVAPGDYMAKDHIVDDEFMKSLEIAKSRAPLHTPVVAAEITRFREALPNVPIIAVSDSRFHQDRPDTSTYYSFDKDIADKYEIKRYGYHGLSVSSIVEYMKEKEILPERMIVAHLGSGASVTAVRNGKSVHNSMGYTPLEGVTMGTRSGSMDIAAALTLKRALKLETDEKLEEYLNKKAGLLGISGTADLRQVIERRDAGDTKAALAYNLFITNLQNAIGLSATILGGIGAIVYAATIGERSALVRRDLTEKLSFLNIALDPELNDEPDINFTNERKHFRISLDSSHPIYIVKSDESAEAIRRALLILG